jgi:hypothetical protein
MATLCREHDLLYIPVPATGSSVVAQVFWEEFGGEQVPEQSIWRDGQMVVSGSHCTVRDWLRTTYCHETILPRAYWPPTCGTRLSGS